jgi:hypothetical protein
VFADRKWAVLTALSLLLVYEIVWNLHEGVTHTMVLICAVAASFLAFMRMVERRATQDYLVFGACICFGLISKWSFAAFCLALAAGALLQPALRARLLDWRILVSVGVAAIVAAPAIYWLVTGGHDLVSVYDQAVAPNASDRLRATLTGLGLALFAPLAFLFPLDGILVVLFPRMVGEAAKSVRAAFSRRVGKDGSSVSWEILILHMTLAGFLILILGRCSQGQATISNVTCIRCSCSHRSGSWRWSNARGTRRARRQFCWWFLSR